MKTIIAMVNFKGGVGKSLHSSMLQSALENSVVVNMDLQDAEKINAGKTVNVMQYINDGEKISDIIDIVMEENDIIILDTPGSLSNELVEIIDRIDYFIVPFQDDEGVIDYTVDTLEAIFNSDFFDSKKEVMLLLNSYVESDDIKTAFQLINNEIEKRPNISKYTNFVQADFKFSRAIKTIKSSKKTIKELMKHNYIAYRIVDKNFETLHNKIKDFIKYTPKERI